MSATLDRWVKKAQEDTAVPEVPVEVNLVKKPTKSGFGETPEDVEYIKDPELKELMNKYKDIKAKIDAAKVQASEILKSAKEQAVAVEKALGVSEMQNQLDDLKKPLRDGLSKLEAEAAIMFRQADNTIAVLQRIREKEQELERPASDTEKLSYVTAELKKAGDIGDLVLRLLEEFGSKIKYIAPAREKDIVTLYPKPKTVKNQKELGIFDRITDFFVSAAHTLALALKNVRNMRSTIEDAQQVAESLDYEAEAVAI